ncbi:MAG: YCII-related protein [Gemmatimonadetes bacterium]|nr:YCII-related protein [Gemmatimonadota bacterium]
MKYMLMMHTPAGTGEYQHGEWKPEDWTAHLAYWDRLNKDLAEAGEFVHVRALTPPAQARLVRAGRRGTPMTDGPFPETKEFLAGFWVVEVDSPERAYAIAARASAAPGPGGAPLNMPIEVRQVMSGPPQDA